MSFRLHPVLSLPGEIRRVAIEELDQAINCLKAEEIHATRSCLKRIRALLKLVCNCTVDPTASAHERVLRDAGRALSGIRDAEVNLMTLDKLRSSRSGKSCPDTLWNKARKTIETSPHDPATTDPAAALRQVEQARRALEHWRPDVRWKDLRRSVRYTYRQARRDYRKACGSRDARKATPPDLRPPDAMHSLRKQFKTLTAQLRLLRPCWPRVIKQWICEAQRIGDLLGRDHDLVILQQRLGSENTSSAAPLQQLLDKRRARLDRDALELARQFLADPPEEFVRRVFKK